MINESIKRKKNKTEWINNNTKRTQLDNTQPNKTLQNVKKNKTVQDLTEQHGKKTQDTTNHKTHEKTRQED